MFKTIPGYNKYVINILGEVRVKDTNSVVPTHRSNGYTFTHILNDEGERISIGIHRCLALAFIPCPGDPNKLVVNHINSHKWNNALANLEWVTRSQNQKHAVDSGLGYGIPTTVIDLRTLEEKKFPTKRQATEYAKVSVPSGTDRGEYIVGNFKFIFHLEEILYENFTSRISSYIVRDIYTRKISIIPKLSQVSGITGIETKVIKRMLKGGKMTYPINGFDIRIFNTRVIWPVYSDEELEAFKGLFFIHNPVKVFSPDGSDRLFGSVLRASAFTATYERIIRECIKTSRPCARGFVYKKHTR